MKIVVKLVGLGILLVALVITAINTLGWLLGGSAVVAALVWLWLEVRG